MVGFYGVFVILTDHLVTRSSEIALRLFSNRGKDRTGSNDGGFRLPQNFGRSLEGFGREQFDPQTGASSLGLLELYELAQPDPDAFIVAVSASARQAGGWALYGGMRAVWHALGSNVSHPDYLALLDESNEFMVAQHGYASLSPMEIERWHQAHGEA